MKRFLNPFFLFLFFIGCDHLPMSPEEPVNTTGDGDVIAKVVSPSSSWGHNYGGAGEEKANALINTTDGGFALCGYADGDFYLVKTDQNGRLLWGKKYGVAGVRELGNDLCQTSDGGYLMAGVDEGVQKTRVVKVNCLGVEQWEKTYPNLNAYYDVSIARSNDGGFVGLLQTSVFKLDCNGTLLWTKDYSAMGLSVGRSIEPASDNGFIIAGLIILKITADGTVQWKKDNSYFFYTHAIQTDDNGYVFAGDRSVRYDEGSMEIVKEVVLTKVDSKGKFIWRKGYFPSVFNYFDYKVQQAKDHSFAIAGFMNYKPTLIKVSSNGNFQWRKSIDDTFLSGEYTDLLASSDGGYILTGEVYTSKNGVWNRQAALVKTDRSGNVR